MFDAFLKIEGIPGESTDAQHKQWIELLSYNFGAAQPHSGSVSSGGSRSLQRVDISPFDVVKALDKASPKLFLHCCNGQHISKIELELCRAGGDKQLYMKYELEDVIVTSYSTSGAAGGDLPSEALSFAMGKVTLTYTETDHKTGKAGGAIPAFWNLHDNKGG